MVLLEELDNNIIYLGNNRLSVQKGYTPPAELGPC